MSGRNGQWSVRGGPVTGIPPILPIRKSDDLRMSKSLLVQLDGHSLSVALVASSRSSGPVFPLGTQNKMDSEYLKNTVGDALTRGCAATATVRPADSLAYLARWLHKCAHDPNRADLSCCFRPFCALR